jgi:hypothetical protein
MIAIYVFIILAAVMVIGGGYATGYWVFDRKKGQDYGEKIDAKENRKVTIKLSNEQKDQLMAFQDKEIVEESGYDQDGFVSLTY